MSGISSSPLASSMLGDVWKRPFTAGYAGHTAFFLSSQLLLASHILFAVETEYNFKLQVVYYCNLSAVVFLLAGAAIVTPYVLSTFREGEVVVQNGPSLIIELIPQLVQNISLLVLILVVAFADRMIASAHQFGSAVYIFMLIGIVGFLLAIASNEDHKERVLIACTILSISLRRPHWFSDLEVTLPMALALIVWIGFLWTSLRSNLLVLRPLELEFIRAKILFVAILILSILVSWMTEFGIFAIAAVLVCNGASYYFERKLGSVSERVRLV